MDDAFQRLARRMWQRAPGQRLWFWFSPDQAPHLVLEPVTRRGTEAFQDHLSSLSEEDQGRQQVGVVFVGDRSQCVFCSASMPRAFLPALADWVRAHIDHTPALLGLCGAGIARLPVVPPDAASVPAALGGVEVRTRPELWADLLPATAAATAAVLAKHLPGERLWFWLWPEATGEAPMLLLSTCAADPTMEQLRHRAQQLAGFSSPEALTGTALLLGDGRLQLVGTQALDREVLPRLARWVRRHAGAQPALARLSGCSYAHLDGESGQVRSIYADDALWQGLAEAPTPGSLAESAAALAGLPVGAVARFWSTTQKPPFIAILPVDADPQGVAFAERVRHMQSRAQQPGLAGTLQRLPSGRLLLTSPSARCAEAAPILARLAEAPGLGALAGAHLSQLADGAILSTTTVSS